MTKTQATAEVFWTAFQSLRPREREAVIHRILADESVRHDLQDLATMESRKREPVRPLRQYLGNAR